MRSPRKAVLRSAGLRAGVVLLVAATVLGVGVVDRTGVGAATKDITVSGAIEAQPDGRTVLDDGSGTYDLVTVIDLGPFLGRTVRLEGTVEATTLYVRRLTMGALEVRDQEGGAVLTATGKVEPTADGFGVTVEGVAFTLTGSDELDQVVGQTADIAGGLVQTEVTLTSLVTADGQTIDIPRSQADGATEQTDWTTGGIPYSSWEDDG